MGNYESMSNESNQPKYGTKFKEAFVVASELHAHQLRKGTDIPYITHLLAVASLVGENGGTENEVISALLHDAVEDQGGAKTLEVILAQFGKEVADIVQDCSDTEIVPKPPWKERKESYLKHLKDCKNPSVILVSCADKLHNLRCIVSDFKEIGDQIWSRFNAGKDESIWYYQGLLNVYKEKKAPNRLLVEYEGLLSYFT